MGKSVLWIQQWSLYTGAMMGFRELVLPTLFLLVSIALFVTTVLYFYAADLQHLLGGGAPTATSTPEQAEHPVPLNAEYPYDGEGIIHFSAVNTNTSDDGPQMRNYYIDAANPGAGVVDTFPVSGVQNVHFATSSLTEGFAVYGDATRSDDQELQYGVAAFTVQNLTRSEITFNDLANEGWYERHLDYSEAQNKLLYITRAEETDDLAAFQDLDTWDIVVYDLETETREVVASGASPAWAGTSGIFLYLAADGIYAYDTETGTTNRAHGVHEELIAASGSEARYSLNHALAVSPDATVAALTSPTDNAILFYGERQDESEGVSLERTNTYRNETGVGHYRPVFSPDGAYFAVLTAVYEPPEYAERSGVHIMIGSVVEPQMLRRIDVSAFDFTTFFLDGWR